MAIDVPPQQTAQEPDPDGRTTPDTTHTQSAPLGLALSGGGIRAALFSLGVVIGLIETGCHRRVRCVASVSGGSILNAVLAHVQSLDSFSSVTEFEPLASKLAATLSRGVLAFDIRTIVSSLWFFFIFLVQRVIPIMFAL